MNPAALAVALVLPFAAPPPDPAHAALVARLGHDEYRERVAAHRELAALGCAALPALRAGMSDPDLEVRVRCAQLSDGAVEAEVARYGVMPWLDSFTSDGATTNTRPATWAQISRYLGEAGGPSGPPYENYRRASRLMVRDWVRLGVPRARIDAEIARARANERLLVRRFPEWLGGERVPAPAVEP